MSIYPGSVPGYRVFQLLRGRDGSGHQKILLGSLFAQTRWRPGVNTAICERFPRRSSHPVPHSDCHCGLQAFHTLSYAEEYRERTLKNAQALIGLVLGAGDVRVHHHGWRAQQAQIISVCIDCPDPDGVFAELIKQRYQISVYSRLSDLESVAEEFGARGVPENLIPAKTLGMRLQSYQADLHRHGGRLKARVARPDSGWSGL